MLRKRFPDRAIGCMRSIRMPGHVAATSRAGRLRLSFHVSHRGQDVERSATMLQAHVSD